MANFNTKDWTIWGAIVGAVTLAISYILSVVMVPTANITLSVLDINVRQRLVSGLDTSIGAKIYGYLGGVLPVSIEGFALILITGMIVTLVGRLAYGLIHKVSHKPTTKLALVLLYGSVAIGLLLGMTPSLSLSFASVVITLAIYYLIVSFIAGWLGTKVLGRSVPN